MSESLEGLGTAVHMGLERARSKGSGTTLTLMVTGSRFHLDRRRVVEVCDLVLTLVQMELDRPWTLFGISGGAPGVDAAFKAWCDARGVPHRPYPADWQRFHEQAGPIRNQQMVDDGQPDLGLAFAMRPKSGTEDAAERLKIANIPLWVDGDDFSRDRIRLESGQLLAHHPLRYCCPPCSIHAPSYHHMRGWPRRWVEPTKMITRVCTHDIPHPDPDDLAYRAHFAGESSVLFWEGIHYCPCHCCEVLPGTEIQGELRAA